MNAFINLLCRLEEAACAKGEVIIRKVTLSVAEPPSCGDDDMVIAENSWLHSSITIFVQAFANFPKSERVREFVKALAHEFRHLDQETAWDILPATHIGVNPETHHKDGWEYEAYYEDPGEKDAREFSERFLETMSDEDLAAIRKWLIETIGNTIPEDDIVVFGK